jgi:FlaA1/EpsC-like NDP-sugar epimerase
MPISLKPLPDLWKGKSVLVTGACGTVGKELVRQIASASTERVIGIDNNESELFFMEEAYKGRAHVSMFLGDICDRDTLVHYMRGVDIVLHAAAFKHVRLCERSPNSTVAVNIQGVQNVIEAATDTGVQRVLFTSSDKAVNPTNVMGTSKLMGERLIAAANSYRKKSGPIFASTRFGNVLGSRGSVIPLFRRQIAAGGPVTLTDERMTRFIMSLSEAVKLVIDSVFLARGGEVFATKMPVVRIVDLAKVLIHELAPLYGHDPARIEVVTVGAKPGEKMYEELLNEEEVRRAVELENYYAVVPAFGISESVTYDYPGSRAVSGLHAYNSEKDPPLSLDALQQLLKRSRLLEREEA